MSLANLSAIEFTDADLKKIDTALLMLEETFAGKLIHDFPAESKAEQESDEIGNICQLPADEGTVLAMAMPAFTNMNQWSSNEKTREQLQPIAARLKLIARQAVYTNRAILQRCWYSSSKY